MFGTNFNFSESHLRKIKSEIETKLLDAGCSLEIIASVRGRLLPAPPNSSSSLPPLRARFMTFPRVEVRHDPIPDDCKISENGFLFADEIRKLYVLNELLKNELSAQDRGVLSLLWSHHYAFEVIRAYEKLHGKLNAEQVEEITGRSKGGVKSGLVRKEAVEERNSELERAWEAVPENRRGHGAAVALAQAHHKLFKDRDKYPGAGIYEQFAKAKRRSNPD